MMPRSSPLRSRHSRQLSEHTPSQVTKEIGMFGQRQASNSKNAKVLSGRKSNSLRKWKHTDEGT